MTDGDIFSCRFRRNASLYPQNIWPSLTLDPDTCRVTYSGSRDRTDIKDLKSAYKLVDIIIEDFDSDGNMKSSSPIAIPVFMIIDENQSCDEKFENIDFDVIPNSRTSKTREIAQFKSEVFSDSAEAISEVKTFDTFKVSGIKQMAGAILNGELGTFKDTDVINYGCSGSFQLI